MRATGSRSTVTGHWARCAAPARGAGLRGTSRANQGTYLAAVAAGGELFPRRGRIDVGPSQAQKGPNPWDAGSARILASLGFEAVRA